MLSVCNLISFFAQNGEPIDFTANERSDEAHFKLLDGGMTLAIFESRPTDNGTYTCTASNPVGHKEATFYLEVQWAPFFDEFGNSLKEITVEEGDSVSFDCLSSGSPTPKVIIDLVCCLSVSVSLIFMSTNQCIVLFL